MMDSHITFEIIGTNQLNRSQQHLVDLQLTHCCQFSASMHSSPRPLPQLYLHGYSYTVNWAVMRIKIKTFLRNGIFRTYSVPFREIASPPCSASMGPIVSVMNLQGQKNSL